MATVGGMRRKFTKDQMGKLLSGNLVSDRETAMFEQQARESAQSALQAQQKLLNRAAAANKAGSPVVAGTMKSAAKGVAQQSADAAVKASGQAQQFSQALREQRKASILNLAQQKIAQNRADLGMVLGAGGGAGAIVAEMT
mgnify:CR=1 FL=1|tara:strand:+ start:1881 stop:2303 length:423 start_codon:yes stop_codon:yes gene_type:complete